MNKIIKFIILCYIISWGIWISLDQLTSLSTSITVLIGACGPSLSAFIFVGMQGGKAAAWRLFKQGWSIKLSIKWYVITILIVPSLFVIVYGLRGGDVADWLASINPVYLLGLFIYMLVVGGTLQEEYGWRGLLLPLLLERYSGLKFSGSISAVLIGIVWSVWHLPLFFMEGTGQSHFPFWLYMTILVLFSCLITYIYHKTNRNLWSAFILHTMFNVSFATVPLF